MADRLVIFGSGGHAKVVVEAALARSPNREIILLDDEASHHGRQVLDFSVSGGRDTLARLQGAPVALGVGDNRARWHLIEWLRAEGAQLETVVHPAATVGRTVELGAGAFVAAGAILIADARIGAGAIINTAASVDHDCSIGEAAHIAPGVHLCGNVTVGARTLIGVGSSARPGATIAADVTIGAGAVVVGDIETAGTYVGNPTRPL
ncbi:MAG TPA: acetyltransferase [Sphingomicrobium sp.]|nr:acetyltransferase [Sphingomicrobium sp.]